MQFFLIFLFAWLIQCGESVIKRSEFQLNASIYDGDNVIYRPHSNEQGYNLYGYPRELCNWLESSMPMNITQTHTTIQPWCKATAYTLAENHTREWGITLDLVTETSTGPLINLTCPTFVGLLQYFLEIITPAISRNRLQFKVHNYLPQPVRFDPQKARDVEILVKAYLCDRTFQPIPVNKLEKFNLTFMESVIKKSHYVNMGYSMVTASEVKIQNLMKFPGLDRMYVNFKEVFPKAYVQALKINPDCDTAKMLEMILTNVQGDAAFFLCGVTANVVPAPTPTTVKPTTTKTTSETETTALASTTKRPMELLVCAFILSHLLANI